MYAQLGNIIFQGLIGFNSFEHTDNTTYAQHDLINSKPILVPTGNDLEELSLEIKLRAEFINPEKARLQLKKSKDTFEVLPLIKGNGQYLGDYVITEMTTTHTQSLADGSVIESTIALTIKEYVIADKLQQQQSNARKQAFAVGDKKPVSVGAIQQPTVPQITGTDLSTVNSFSFIVDRKSSEYINNVSQRQSLSDKIQKSLQNIDSKLEGIRNVLPDIPGLTNVSGIGNVIDQVRAQISNFSFPIVSIDDLRTNNRNFQQSIRSLNSSVFEIINLILTRAA